MINEPNADVRLRLAKQDIHAQWEGDYLNSDRNEFYSAAFDRIISELGDTEGKVLLDVGCGYCHHTIRLLKTGLKITAVDFSDVALAHAREMLANRTDQVTLQQADATNLSFADKSFDFVLMWGVLMHIPHANKALAEVSRVLRPGGKLVLYEVNHRSFDVSILEPLINATRRLVGKDVRERNKVALGIEEWHQSESGRLVVRKTDFPRLETYCKTLGLHLSSRFAGELTEVYTRLPSRLLKRTVYALNRVWFQHVRSPHLAMTNIVVFEKA